MRKREPAQTVHLGFRVGDGAPVSVPVSWQALGRATAANQYTVRNLMQRMRGLKRDPWAEIGRLKQSGGSARIAAFMTALAPQFDKYGAALDKLIAATDAVAAANAARRAATGTVIPRED